MPCARLIKYLSKAWKICASMVRSTVYAFPSCCIVYTYTVQLHHHARNMVCFPFSHSCNSWLFLLFSLSHEIKSPINVVISANLATKTLVVLATFTHTESAFAWCHFIYFFFCATFEYELQWLRESINIYYVYYWHVACGMRHEIVFSVLFCWVHKTKKKQNFHQWEWANERENGKENRKFEFARNASLFVSIFFGFGFWPQYGLNTSMYIIIPFWWLSGKGNK